MAGKARKEVQQGMISSTLSSPLKTPTIQDDHHDLPSTEAKTTARSGEQILDRDNCHLAAILDLKCTELEYHHQDTLY